MKSSGSMNDIRECVVEAPLRLWPDAAGRSVERYLQVKRSRRSVFAELGDVRRVSRLTPLPRAHSLAPSTRSGYRSVRAHTTLATRTWRSYAVSTHVPHRSCRRLTGRDGPQARGLF